MELINCVIYYSLTGFMCFLFGRFVPKKLFNPNMFPFRTFGWEKNGTIYESTGVKQWQNKVPDMSKMFPGIMPAKSVGTTPDSASIMIMLRETCVAELVHWILFLWGLGCFRFFKFKTAVIVYIIYVAANAPYIIIQRYNRPRLRRLLECCKKREAFLAVSDADTDEISVKVTTQIKKINTTKERIIVHRANTEKRLKSSKIKRISKSKDEEYDFIGNDI